MLLTAQIFVVIVYSFLQSTQTRIIQPQPLLRYILATPSKPLSEAALRAFDIIHVSLARNRMRVFECNL